MSAVELLERYIGLEGAREALAEVNAMVEALQFYADESAWNQPPVKTVAHDVLGPAYENQASKVRLDRGRIARAALTSTQSPNTQVKP